MYFGQVNRVKDANFHMLKPIVKGQILKLLNKQLATVSLPGGSVTAKVDAPVEVGASYLFKTTMKKEKLHLKIINRYPSEMSDPSQGLNNTLKYLGLPTTAKNNDMLSALLRLNLPVNHQIIETISQVVSDMSDQKLLKYVHSLIMKGITPTREIVQAYKSFHHQQELPQIMENLKKNQVLKPFFALLEKETGLNGGGPAVFKNLLRLLGLGYEQKILNEPHVIQETLKSQLIHLVNSSENKDVKESAQLLLQHLTGQQLQVIMGQRDWFQLYFHLPLFIGDRWREIVLSWEGKRNKGGLIDPNDCRMLFYLELEHLNETMIQLQIQNRLLSITITNHDFDLHSQLQAWKPILKDKLGNLGYQLTSLKQGDASLSQKKKELFDQVDSLLDVKV